MNNRKSRWENFQIFQTRTGLIKASQVFFNSSRPPTSSANSFTRRIVSDKGDRTTGRTTRVSRADGSVIVGSWVGFRVGPIQWAIWTLTPCGLLHVLPQSGHFAFISISQKPRPTSHGLDSRPTIGQGVVGHGKGLPIKTLRSRRQRCHRTLRHGSRLHLGFRCNDSCVNRSVATTCRSLRSVATSGRRSMVMSVLPSLPQSASEGTGVTGHTSQQRRNQENAEHDTILSEKGVVGHPSGPGG